VNNHNTVQSESHPPQHGLFVGAMAAISSGYLIRMVEIGWDAAKGKKRLVRNPGEDWQHGAQLTQAQVMEGIRSGCNAYLYRLPDGVFVVDADTDPAREALTAILGQPDVVTPRGGAHWLTTEQLAPQPGIDTDPRQLYGPGSFYVRGDGALAAYVGVIPPVARPLHPAMPRKVAANPGARGPATKQAPSGVGGALGAYLDQRTPHSTTRADAAIASALAALRAHPAEAGAGFRTALLKAAMTLGGYVGAGHLEPDDAREHLEAAVDHVWGAADSDDQLWIQQGLTDGAARPFAVYDPVDAVFDPEPAGGEVSEEQRRKHTFFDVIGRHPFDPDQDDSDQGLADAVLMRTRPGLRRAVDTGGWVVAGPQRWEELGDSGRAEWAVSVVARLMPLGRKVGASEEKDDAHWQAVRRDRFVKTAGSGAVASKMRAITGGADHPSALRITELDTEPEVLWAGGLPWDLRASRGQLVPAAIDPLTPHLHSALVAPQAGPTPAWDAFLAAVWPDPEVRAWALRVMSVALTGHPDAALPVFYGPERTGKSSFVSLVVKLLGTYAHAADPRLLGAANAHASIVYALKGRRLSFIDEGPRRGQLATERLKQLTGGTELTGNAMNQNPITFAPTHTLVMTTNDEPLISDAALAARMRIIPCEGDQDAVRVTRGALTPEVLELEAPAILAALMFEAAAWLADRTSGSSAAAPATVREMVAEISATQDVFAAWVSARTRPDEQGTKSRDLYNNFVLWYRDNPAITDRAIPTETAWGVAMTRLHVPPIKRMDANYRALSLSGGGDVSWAVTPVHGGFMDGYGGSKPTTLHAETPTSNPTNSPSMEGMEGLDSSSLREGSEKEGESKYERALGDVPSTIHASAQPAPGELIKCHWCGATTSLTKSIKYKVHKFPGGDRCMWSGDTPPGVLTVRERKAHERAQLRVTKIAEAAGPLLTLPAAMRRGEGPREVDLAEAAAVLEACLARNGGRLAVDVEHNALPAWHPEYEVQTIQLGDWAEAVDLDAGDPVHRQLASAYLREATELEAYSYTADLVPLARLGVIEYAEALAKCIDVATIVKLTDPALTENGDGLKETSKAVLGAAAVSPGAEAAREALGTAAGWIWQLKPDTPREKNGWAQIDKRCAVMVTYALADVLDCSALQIRLPQPDPAVMAREIVAERVVAKLPYLGLALDGPAVRAQLDEREPRALAKLTRIRELGVDNPDSPKQVTTRLTQLGAILPRTKPSKANPEGNLTAAKDVLEKLTNAPGELGELATTIMAYRDDATVLKNMIRPWARSTEHGDGRTYPTIYTLGADTGRMSCVRPNLQQVAREGGLRECILADPGYLLIAADFSSVEVRVAAYLSGDQNLIAMVNQGVDLHGVIAEHAYGPGWTKAQRYNVKSVVFGRIYGGGVGTLAAQSGLTHEMTQRLIDILDAIAPQLAAWSDSLRQAVKNGLREFRTYSGRVIHLDPRLPHKAPNFAIQGTARELLVDALIRWEAGPYAGGIVLPVHDEIVAMVKAEDAPAATAFLERCMVTQLGPVPITVEADEPAERWQSAA
jgi:P4 family phage/plasmid primase-like protien